ncbi:MAG: hypothetical protein ACK5X3_23750 [Pseudomonadota bacterium]
MQANPKVSASRSFNEHGYNWYPQVWVEAYGQWFDVTWARHRHPEGWTSPDDAIRYVLAEM